MLDIGLNGDPRVFLPDRIIVLLSVDQLVQFERGAELSKEGRFVAAKRELSAVCGLAHVIIRGRTGEPLFSPPNGTRPEAAYAATSGPSRERTLSERLMSILFRRPEETRA